MKEQYLTLKNHISKCALEAGRRPEQIILVCVSKYATLDEMKTAYQLGIREFGESKIQSALEKMDAFDNDVHWHYIGRLQSNKVGKVVGRFCLIHSVHTFELAELISKKSRQTGLKTPILLQVNTSGELSKQGFSPEELKARFCDLKNLSGLDIQGLMTMAPLTEDQHLIRKSFAGLRCLRDKLRSLMNDFSILPHLSMGMSQDYPIAIEEGATIIRIGSKIFS